jgi:very-short-patch-repair endonuclease
MYRDHDQREFARSLRNQPTTAEGRLWHFLKAGQLGVKFRRQAAIGSYVVDFVCFSHKLIIELDGPQHLDSQAIEYDKQRTMWLFGRGFHVIRFRNQELDENIHGVVDRIARALMEFEPPKTPPSPFAARPAIALALGQHPVARARLIHSPQGGREPNQ